MQCVDWTADEDVSGVVHNMEGGQVMCDVPNQVESLIFKQGGMC